MTAALTLGRPPPPKPVVVPLPRNWPTAESLVAREAVAVPAETPVEAAPAAPAPLPAVAAPRAKPRRAVSTAASTFEPAPFVDPTPAPPLQTHAPAAAAVQASADAPAQHPQEGQACWRAVGASWSFIGYASRQGCAAQAFDNACQIVHARWGKDQLRRYDGKLQAKGAGALARWRTIGASSCPDPAAAR